MLLFYGLEKGEATLRAILGHLGPSCWGMLGLFMLGPWWDIDHLKAMLSYVEAVESGK